MEMGEAQTQTPQVSATIMLDQLALMRELYGADLVARAVTELPPARRTEVEGLLRGAWCSVAMAFELKQVVARLAHEDLFSLQRRVVRLGIERTLTTFWRFFMHMISDERLARRAPMLYSKTFDRGSFQVIAFRPGGADLELHGWPDIPEFDLIGLMTGIETVFTLAGRLNPQVDARRDGGRVLLTATWKAKAKTKAG
jgi:hypothetical protein